MVAVTSYTLPPVQVVYYLTTLVNVTSSVPSLEQSPPQQQTTLPDGYVANPDLGVAYKYHNDLATWAQARNICQNEGAQLAVIDSAKKSSIFTNRQGGNNILAGIIRIDGVWINVNTGSTLPTQSSLPWSSGQPGSEDCVLISGGSSELLTMDCTESRTFACELPLPLNYKIAAN